MMSLRAQFAGVVDALIVDARSRHPDRAPLIGVAGAQGSGKSFQCRAYASAHASGIAHFSLDDVYFTRAERDNLARNVHPLFATRGVPGTHDLALAEDVIEALQAGAAAALPRFDKARDDRAAECDWAHFEGDAEAILFDGWCVGASAAADGPAINALEAEEDGAGVWRAASLGYLAGAYQGFFDRFEAFIYLQAPSFDIVRRWRGQQEKENLGRMLRAEEEQGLDRFVQHYERITRSMLEGHHRARHIFHLDEDRVLMRVEERA